MRNSVAGSKYLIEKVERCCAKYRIRKSQVLFGGEDPPEYVWNFIGSIQAAGYAFVRVNAKEARKHRTNTRATSDALALDGIAQVMLLRRAYDLAPRDEVYGAMKLAERARRKLKRQETALKNRIHRIADVLFPGLLKESLSGLLPFSVSCLNLMEAGCSVVRIKRMRTDTLAKRLKEGRTQKPGQVAEKLKGGLPIDSNHHLKDQLLQAAYHTGHNRHPAWKRLGLSGEHPLFEHYQRVELREGKSRLSTAKKLLRTASAMVRDERVYLPPNALNPSAPDAMAPGRFVAYLQIVAEMLKAKWKGYDLSGIPEESNQLIRWRQGVNELNEYVLKNK